MRPPPALVSATGAGMLAAVLYPLGLERALEAFGVRPVAAALLVPGVASLWVWQRWGRFRRASLAPHLLLLALPAAAAASGRIAFLHAVPALIQLLIAAFFALSLRDGSSILERAAQTIHPYAPDFIGPYCRKATLVFAALFAAQGLAIAGLALDPPVRWALSAGLLAWGPVTLASVVEWAIRKTWFRYYGDGPIDRQLRRLWPPENTAAGRRSLAYVRAKRLELGMPPP